MWRRSVAAEVTDGAGASYSCSVSVDDQTGHATVVPVTVSVVTGNLAPVAHDTIVSLPENSVAGAEASPAVSASDRDVPAHQLTYTLQAFNDTDAMTLFDIDASSGVVRVAAGVAAGRLDFERKPLYWMTVIVQDNGPGTLSDFAVVTVSLTNVNEDPVCPSWSGVVDENAGAGVVVSHGPATCTDAESPYLAYAVQGANPAFVTNLTETFGVELLVAPGAVIDYESTPGHVLTIVVEASDGDGGSANMVVPITIRDVNEAPEFTPETKALAPTLAEDTAPGTVVTSVNAMDYDAGDVVVYSLTGGTDKFMWAVDALSGQLTLLGELDFETAEHHDVVFAATDPSGASDVFTMTVAVTDVDDVAVTSLYVQTDAFDASLLHLMRAHVCCAAT